MLMKKISILLIAIPCFLSCLRNLETCVPERLEGLYTSVSASLVRSEVPGETKSVCTADAESFTEAYLFAFRSGEQTIYAAKHVTRTDSFQWTLPRGENLEIWALANPAGNTLKALLENSLEDARLTRQNLLDLPHFSCPSAASLKELDGDGTHLPMSAIVAVRFDGARGTLTVPLKRLFAKYELKLNWSRFLSEGWTVRAAGVKCVNCNGSVPYFYDGPGAGYAAEAGDLVSLLDHDDGDDLDCLNELAPGGSSGWKAFFYLPENCQGTILSDGGVPAQSWKTVYQELGTRVSACSYISVNVAASKEGVPERRFSYRIYPGNERTMNRNFDIVRNTFRALTVTLTPGLETDGFRWTNAQAITVEPGGTVDIPFETSLDSPCFSVRGSGLEWVETAGGCARFRALADAREGTVRALGGDEGFEVSDSVPVSITSLYPVRGVIPPGHCYFETFRLSVSPCGSAWPPDVDPSLLSVVSTARSGAEAVEILSGPLHDGGGWYFTARCTGPRSAADPSETLLIRDEDGNTVGMVEIPDVRAVFSLPAVSLDSPYVLPCDGADCATVEYSFETEDGAGVSVPNRHLALVSADSMVDDLYVEYYDGRMDVYLPGWEGIPGLQDFDQSQLSQEPYLQSIANALQLRSRTGYVFHSEALTFLIPNPFAGLDPVIPHPTVVSGNKVDLPSDWVLKKESGSRVMEWHLEKNRNRPSMTFTPVLLSSEGYLDAGTSYRAAPGDGNGHLLPYDIVRIPCDERTYGQIGFSMEVSHVRSGETARAMAAVVDVVRELEITATFRIHQRHYPLLNPNDDEAWIQVSAKFNRMTALNPFVRMDFLKTSANSATTVHPTKAEAESLGSYWVNYAASLGTHAFFGGGTRYILPAEDNLSYEIQWNPGPTAGFFNYRVITLWNPPQFDFDLAGFRQKYPNAFPNMRIVPASGDMCRYLEMDAYTRIVFYWERWRSAEWTDGGKGWYLCDNEDITPRYASAYYTPLSTVDPLYGRCFFGNPSQTGTDVDPVYGGDPFFIQSAVNTFETILDY